MFIFEESIFQINNKIEIFYDDKYFRSTIQDYNQNNIAISIPYKEGIYLPLTTGDPLDCLYCNNKSTYQFDTYVIGRKFEGIPMLLIGMPKDLKEVQRRQCVRISLFKDILYCKAEIMDKLHVYNPLLKAVMLDLSANGMKVVIQENLILEEKLQFSINLDEEIIYLNGKVIRIEKGENNTNIYGIEFIEIDRNTDEKIVKFIFAKMRSQMKKVK